MFLFCFLFREGEFGTEWGGFLGGEAGWRFICCKNAGERNRSAAMRCSGFKREKQSLYTGIVFETFYPQLHVLIFVALREACRDMRRKKFIFGLSGVRLMGFS